MLEVPGLVIDRDPLQARTRIKRMLEHSLPTLQQQAADEHLPKTVRDRARKGLQAVQEDLKNYN